MLLGPFSSSLNLSVSIVVENNAVSTNTMLLCADFMERLRVSLCTVNVIITHCSSNYVKVKTRGQVV